MLIAVEGLPGSGKTTQARLLTEHLNRAGASAVFLPDNLTRAEDPLGQKLLQIFDSGDPFARHGSVIADTFLAAAIRANTFPAFIAPAVGALAGRAADHSLWLRMPPGQAIQRAERRQGHSYSGEQRVYLHRVHDAYDALAAADPSLRAVDVTGLAEDQAHEAVLAVLAAAGSRFRSPCTRPAEEYQ